MKIEVHHLDVANGQFVHVATVTIPDDARSRPGAEEAALDYAYRWTNNVNGSWSRGQRLPDPHGRRDGTGPVTWSNPDYNPNTEVVAPLPVYGLRSSMVGDSFVIVDDDGQRRSFVVANLGFVPVP